MSNKQSSNELARVEMLIILQYLLMRTDKNNLSSQKKIQEFAKEKYDINIKRQRINECLVSLNFISIFSLFPGAIVANPSFPIGAASETTDIEYLIFWVCAVGLSTINLIEVSPFT